MLARAVPAYCRVEGESEGLMYGLRICVMGAVGMDRTTGEPSSSSSSIRGRRGGVVLSVNLALIVVIERSLDVDVGDDGVSSTFGLCSEASPTVALKGMMLFTVGERNLMVGLATGDSMLRDEGRANSQEFLQRSSFIGVFLQMQVRSI